MLFLLFLLRVLLRRDWDAIAVFVLVSGAGPAVSFTWATWPANLASGALHAVVLLRFGLVAEIVRALVWTLFMISPMTLQTSAWYAGAGYAVFFYIGLIALYGFKTALAGRTLLDEAVLK